jgi:hypothetical protein
MHSYNLACTVLVIRYKTSVLLSDILDHCLKERLEIKMMPLLFTSVPVINGFSDLFFRHIDPFSFD